MLFATYLYSMQNGAWVPNKEGNRFQFYIIFNGILKAYKDV